MHWTIFSGDVEVISLLPVAVSQACYHFKKKKKKAQTGHLFTSKLAQHYTANKDKQGNKEDIL